MAGLEFFSGSVGFRSEGSHFQRTVAASEFGVLNAFFPSLFPPTPLPLKEKPKVRLRIHEASYKSTFHAIFVRINYILQRGRNIFGRFMFTNF